MMIWQIGISVFILAYLILTWTYSAPPGVLHQILKPILPILHRLHLSQIWRNFDAPADGYTRMWVEVQFANGALEKFLPFASRHPWTVLRPMAGHKLNKFQVSLLRSSIDSYVWVAFRQHLREYASSLGESAVVKLTLNIERTLIPDWNDQLGQKKITAIDCMPKSPVQRSAV